MRNKSIFGYIFNDFNLTELDSTPGLTAIENLAKYRDIKENKSINTKHIMKKIETIKDHKNWKF
jgi:hypothetical protein